MGRVQQVAYIVPKLTDYSAAALEKAAQECVHACTAESREVRDDADLKFFRDRWMARKNGILTQVNDLWLKGAPKDAKREAGIRVNEIKSAVADIIDKVEHTRLEVATASLDSVDISLP